MAYPLFLPDHVIHGALGGLLYVLVAKLGYAQRWDILRRVLLGAIIGYILGLLNFPNHETAIGLGYLGIDAIEGVFTKSGHIKLICEHNR